MIKQISRFGFEFFWGECHK